MLPKEIKKANQLFLLQFLNAVKGEKRAIVFRIPFSAFSLTADDTRAETHWGIHIKLWFIIYVMTYTWTLISYLISPVIKEA